MPNDSSQKEAGAAPGRAERRKRETRARLLGAAGALFGEVGYQATSVEAICEQADVARQTFFNHFASKGALLEELVEIGSGFLCALAERARKEGASTPERLTIFFESYEAMASEMGPRGGELVSEAMAVGHGSRHGGARIRMAVEALVREGIAEGDVTECHAVDELVTLVLGAFLALQSQWSSGPRGGEGAARRMVALLADAIAPPPGAGRDEGRRTSRAAASGRSAPNRDTSKRGGGRR